jgi:hypothetical protein
MFSDYHRKTVYNDFIIILQGNAYFYTSVKK